MAKKPKTHVSFRVDEDVREKIVALAEKMELSQAQVVECAIRAVAKKHLP